MAAACSETAPTAPDVHLESSGRLTALACPADIDRVINAGTEVAVVPGDEESFVYEGFVGGKFFVGFETAIGDAPRLFPRRDGRAWNAPV